MKSSKEIRNDWINFFKSKNHLFLESKSLVPYKDDSLLWINSGVATLKDYFSGKKEPESKRLVNSQRALRTNDIENVGVTSRHHTFFEMLGNFSIGDYFKEYAIELADEFLTKIMKFDKNKLYITYFEEDVETKEKWISLGYDENHIIKGNKKTNFWDVGMGPCGPCTEIFYDRGEKFDKRDKILIENDIENDRYIEIWNIVFSEFNNLGNNKYVPLAQKNIDTGAGLERIVSIVQDTPTNFDSDLFLPIIKSIEDISKFEYKPNNYFEKEENQNKINMYFKIIADHARASISAISDGVLPSNSLRGYVIRRLIRRAYFYGKKIGINESSFLYKIVPIVKQILELDFDVESIQKIIKEEEEKFSKTIEKGEIILNEELNNNKNNFSPEVAFKLYETYGFPLDMTKDILREYDIFLDDEELEKLKIIHAKKSKSLKNNEAFKKTINSLSKISKKMSSFVGYEKTKNKTNIVSIMNEEDFVSKGNGNLYVILKNTPFYATSGGQRADKGFLVQKGNKIELLDVFKDKFSNNIHYIRGKIDKKYEIECFVDEDLRKGSMRNHSATHLTFAALRNIYANTNIQQLGSDNNPERLTFDFSLKRKPTEEEILEIEKFVKNAIKKEIEREYIVTTTEEAKNIGAIMTIEEEEYMDKNNIRIVRFKDISTDLCGGTHVENTKDIENYKIIGVENKGSNIWRIKAITSNSMVFKFWKDANKILEENLQNICKKIKEFDNKKSEELAILNLEDNIYKKNNTLKERIKKGQEIIKNNIKNKSKEKTDISLIKFEEFNFKNNKIILVNNLARNNTKEIIIELREKNPDSIIVGNSNCVNKLLIITSKNKDIQNVVNSIKNNIEIKGGGNKNMWQGMSKEKVIKSHFE